MKSDMHGDPFSKWDNRILWKYFDYKDFGIIGEPYFDVNFENMLYLTDTGRTWNGKAVSIRDKPQNPVRDNGLLRFESWKVKPVPGSLMNMTPQALEFQNKYNFNSTVDIINSLTKDNCPENIFFNFHPQRWTNNPILWFKELVYQNIKNVFKHKLIYLRG
jgi:hypothetical protein